MDKNILHNDIIRFLREDVAAGDITSAAIFSPEQRGEARFVARQEMVTAGMVKVAAEVFTLLEPDCVVRGVVDGTKVSDGRELLKIKGTVLNILKGERLALNLVQRLCGIATLTGKFVEEVKGLPVKIVDTRKTTPGLRALEKYAVRVGGGHNHRFSLADGILVKDNHIAACGSIIQAVEKIRNYAPHTLRIEVETETLGQVEECLACGVDIIMLDNMAPEMMRRAVKLIGHRAIIEASGGITLENIREVAECGVDIISVGRLTHSAPACDISMEMNS